MMFMEGQLVVVSVPPGSPQLVNPKENHTEVSINYKTVLPISSGFLLAIMTYINPLF